MPGEAAATGRRPALSEAVGDLGSTLGPVAATALAGFGYGSFFIVNAAIAVVALLVFWRWASARPGPPPALPAIS